MDLSLFLLKNALGSKMKKSFRKFCNGDGCTSTLNQQTVDHNGSSCAVAKSPLRESQPTLEEMILQLELEEKMARTAKLDECIQHHRMSCVNSSDILRTARNALNQYPRFSLDGRDSMYRSSFRNLAPINTRVGDLAVEKTRRLPAIIGGESVIWRKPGIVAKLMGLEAMPIPVNSRSHRRERLSSIIKKQNLRRRVERHEIERRRLAADAHACSKTGRYCAMKPVAGAGAPPNGEVGWPMRHFQYNI
ncbi:uncharacterized protein Fot_16473 [Forsythia ovata]|uniref:DUF3741 domain-containing protein n=1 Tax=Forsythia ovata TaxID=205694 RepID=A0ABD1WCM6_9LAMI